GERDRRGDHGVHPNAGGSEGGRRFSGGGCLSRSFPVGLSADLRTHRLPAGGSSVLFLIWILLSYLIIKLPPPRPEVKKKGRRSTIDRIAWTVFGLGFVLLFFLSFYAAQSESDGAFRSWETIRRHTRIFLLIAAVTVGIPALIFLYQTLGS